MAFIAWINHVVENEPEYGAMGIKGQFIIVLPKRNAVVVMTSILPTDGGLRTATYPNLHRRMVNDYILPAVQARERLKSTSASQQALRNEIELSRQTTGVRARRRPPTTHQKNSRPVVRSLWRLGQ